MSALPFEAATAVAMTERRPTPLHGHGSHVALKDPMRDLYRAMTACDTFAKTAEKGLLNEGVIAREKPWRA